MGKKKNTKYHKEYDVSPVLMSLLLWNVGVQVTEREQQANGKEL